MCGLVMRLLIGYKLPLCLEEAIPRLSDPGRVRLRSCGVVMGACKPCRNPLVTCCRFKGADKPAEPRLLFRLHAQKFQPEFSST